MLEIPDDFQRILRPHLPYADSGAFEARDELAGLGLDSMGVVQLLVDIENGYAVALPDDILDEETFATVGSLWEALVVHIG
ncbi:phosphopantetheine-binding protein [Nonomuraea sp. NPDC050790]|uniref:phosphopantetheine-binding protein n=1 Tax=Nonomuraea sp. NPDC050790 TaxID=3364371 RepID=UPI0037B30DE2